jgi:hypothetical protein
MKKHRSIEFIVRRLDGKRWEWEVSVWTGGLRFGDVVEGDAEEAIAMATAAINSFLAFDCQAAVNEACWLLLHRKI